MRKCKKRGERKARKENKKHIIGERRERKMGTFEKGEGEVIEVSDVAKMVSQMKKKESPNSPIFHQNRGRYSQDFLQSFLFHGCLNCKLLTYKVWIILVTRNPDSLELGLLVYIAD